jgi:Glyoxalase-like domain
MRVAHFSRLYTAVVDVPGDRHDGEVTFWQGVLGRDLTRIERHPEFVGGMLPGDTLAFLVQRRDEGPPRVHLDIHTDDLEAEVARLERLGARRVRYVNGWWIMEDPAGLPFCVIEHRGGVLDETNAQRWE